jgi:hypothetical protein
VHKPYYVTLTGGKNNAGDFLIKYRAFKLFRDLRPDREIIDYNEWEPIDDERLAIINRAEALILLGGPGLVKNMYPNGAYRLRENLDDIKVPILMMGIGWKSLRGGWEDTYHYPLSKTTLSLLDKIESSGYVSSVRDYHTLNVLHQRGYKNFHMTGCPAYYDEDFFTSAYTKEIPRKVAFSLGVSFVYSPSMEQQMKEMILATKNYYEQSQFEVVFHHSIDKNTLEKAYHADVSKHYSKHKEFVTWLEKEQIGYVDISGSAENLIHYYSGVNVHVGYRVHAHIFMNSISKYSILISEDGRGKATRGVIGGIVLDGYRGVKVSFAAKVLNKLFSFYDRFIPNTYLKNELLKNMTYEEQTDYRRIKNSRLLINNNFTVMKSFLRQLP